jgi:hypothetical protein
MDLMEGKQQKDGKNCIMSFIIRNVYQAGLPSGRRRR